MSIIAFSHALRRTTPFLGGNGTNSRWTKVQDTQILMQTCEDITLAKRFGCSPQLIQERREALNRLVAEAQRQETLERVKQKLLARRKSTQV